MLTNTLPEFKNFSKPIRSLNCQSFQSGSFDLSQAIRFLPGNGHTATPLQISGVQTGKKISKNSIIRVSDIHGRHSEEEVKISQLQNPEAVINCIKRVGK